MLPRLWFDCAGDGLIGNSSILIVFLLLSHLFNFLTRIALVFPSIRLVFLFLNPPPLSKNTVEIMDLLLRINLEQRVTCLMVTHNPDLECYADRVLYVRDGRFERQVLNRQQTRIDYESYMRYLDTL